MKPGRTPCLAATQFVATASKVGKVTISPWGQVCGILISLPKSLVLACGEVDLAEIHFLAVFGEKLGLEYAGISHSLAGITGAKKLVNPPVSIISAQAHRPSTFPALARAFYTAHLTIACIQRASFADKVQLHLAGFLLRYNFGHQAYLK